MAKIIDFKKRKVDDTSKKTPKTLKEYIREQEIAIDSLSKAMQRGLRNRLGSKTKEEAKRCIDHLMFLAESWNSLKAKIENAGIGATNKKKLLNKMSIELDNIKVTRIAYEAVVDHLLKEGIPNERINEKKDKKRKAIRRNTRKNVR